MYQHAVAQREPIVDIRLGEGEIDGQVEVPCAWAIDADRQDVKDLVRRQLGCVTASSIRTRLSRRHADPMCAL